MIMNKNLDYERALHAYTCIEEIKNSGNEKLEKDYHSAVLSSGIKIHRFGLMQTLSLYLSKKNNKHHEKLAYHIMQWICKDSTTNDLLQIYQNILSSPDEEIFCKTQEAKSIVIWLKRYADTMLKVNKHGDTSQF